MNKRTSIQELNKLYCGDSLNFMKEMEDNSIDLIITDPPYGISIGSKDGQVGGGSCRGETKKYGKQEWDSKRIKKEYFNEMKRIAKNMIVWGGNYYLDYLGQTRCMLIWYKRDGLPIRTFADCEIAWTSFDKNSMVFNCRWDGFIRDSREKKVHPTQKALEVIKWCVQEFSKEGDLILDPFLGGGTTAVACKMLKRKFIGIELSEEYFKVANERLSELNDDGTTAFLPTINGLGILPTII